ncbi:hypothetical protein JTB14_019611 [Gonioctena quinquepunctata]|nr:hypothetical protein JTB14_019611 [Gonioctena quinquepunctata]
MYVEHSRFIGVYGDWRKKVNGSDGSTGILNDNPSPSKGPDDPTAGVTRRNHGEEIQLQAGKAAGKAQLPPKILTGHCSSNLTVMGVEDDPEWPRRADFMVGYGKNPSEEPYFRWWSSLYW